MALPISLLSHRSKFLGLREDAEVTTLLRELWRSAATGAVAAGILPADQVLPEDSLGATLFQHEDHLCVLIQFPSAQAPGEAFLGFVVAGPSEEWASPKARETLPVRYFLLERSGSAVPTLFEWRATSTEDDEQFESRGPGPAPGNPVDFIDRVFGLCGIPAQWLAEDVGCSRWSSAVRLQRF